MSDLAISQLKIVERVYLADNEKNYYKEMRSSDSKLGEDKVKLARIQYRGKGKYIDAEHMFLQYKTLVQNHYLFFQHVHLKALL